jgi:uncharacterized membrane protein YbhN (UPF0104 family)
MPGVPPPLLRAAKIAVALALLALVWHLADGRQAARMLAAASPGWLAAAFAALTLQTLLSALRWRLTAARLGIDLGLRVALREYYLSQIMNQVLPGGVLGDAGRALRTRSVAGLMAAGQAVVFERLAGQIALFAVMAGAFAATLVVPGGLVWPHWAAWMVAALIAAGLGLPLLVWAMGRVSRQWLALRAWRPLRHLADQSRALVHALAAPDVRARQIAFSLLAVLCNIAAFGFCIRAVGVVMPVAATLAIVPLILFAMVIPLTISGWGLREGAAAALFPIAGASASDGLAASIAFGLVFAATVLPGLALLVLAPHKRETEP